MSSPDQFRGTLEKIGKLTPILLDAHGNIIDGFHRVKKDPKWKDYSVTCGQIDDPTKLALARLASNVCRRIVSSDEIQDAIRKLHKTKGWTPKQLAEMTGMGLTWAYAHWPNDIKDKTMQALRKGKKTSVSKNETTRDQLSRNVCKEFGLGQGELTPSQVSKYLKMNPLDQRRMIQSFKANLSNGKKLLPKQLFKKIEKKLDVIVLVNKRRVVPHATDSAEDSSLCSLSPPKANVNPNHSPSADLILQVPQRLEEKSSDSTLEERFATVPFTWKQWKPQEIGAGVVDPSKYKHSQFPKECICAHCPAILKCQFGIKPSK